MKQQFIIKNEKAKTYRMIRRLLTIFNLLVFVYLLILDESRIAGNWYIILSIVALAAFIFFEVIEITANKPSTDFWYRIVFIYCALVWLGERIWWAALLMLVFCGLDYLAHRRLVITVSDKWIIIPSVPEKKIEWNELSNLVLKDDLLTIDMKNNRLFQHQVISSDWDVNEEEFNKFCNTKIRN